MGKKLIFVLSILPLIISCSTIPKELPTYYDCSISEYGKEGSFNARFFLSPEGYQFPQLFREVGLFWTLNAKDGSLVAHAEHNPWKDNNSSYRGGAIDLYVNWVEKPPVGTRILLKIEGSGKIFEGFSVGEKSYRSSINETWIDFISEMKTSTEAEVIFMSPTGEMIKKLPMSLVNIHHTKEKFQELKEKVDLMARDYKKTCELLTYEEIILR